MDDAARERLVLLCRRYGVTLIIDETLADVVVEPGPAASPVAAHEPSGAVLSIGSLSKSVWPGLRVGWIRASPAQVGALAALRATNDLGGPVVEQLAGTALVPEQERVAAARQPRLRAQRDALIGAATALGWRTETPRGGLATWVELPTGSSSLLADVAYRRGVVVIPGPRFSADGALDRYLRLPYTLPEETIRAAMQRLGSAWEDIENGRVVEPTRLQVV